MQFVSAMKGKRKRKQAQRLTLRLRCIAMMWRVDQSMYAPAGLGAAGSNLAIWTFLARPSFSITQMP